MKQLLLLVCILTSSVAFAQHYSIKGRVAERGGEGLPYASVFLLQAKDSSVLASTTTSEQGAFILEKVGKGNYLLKITYVGYAPFLKNISTPAQSNTLQLGKLELLALETELAAVTIVGERPAVLVKEDTVAYLTGSFYTRPNANVEQLLKKLPGLELQRDGSVQVQGQTVTRIFVDGKEFFGGNVQMATKNLPADAIESIEVIDGRSEESRFSGIDDGKREKVINLTLKEERKDMGFGKAMAGGGTNNRYAGQASYNRFSEKKQLSLMGMSNNISIQDFAGSDELGGGEGSAGAVQQPGLQTFHSGGGHLFQQLRPKTSVIASYQFNHAETQLREKLVRQNFQPEGTAMYYENSLQQNKSKGHQFHTTLEHKGGKNTLRLNTSLNYSDMNTASTYYRKSFSVDDTLVNRGERTAGLENKKGSLLAMMFWGHRFKKAGRLFTLTNQLSAYESDSEGSAESITHFSGREAEAVHQQNRQENTNLSYSLRAAYTEPLGGGHYLQANYHISNRRSESALEVWDIVNEGRQLNAEQSNRFQNTYLSQQTGVTYRFNRKKLSMAWGASLQQSTLGRKLPSQGSEDTQTFYNVLPNAIITRQLSRNGRLNLSYSTFVREPSLNQLQPVVSRFDPLYVLVGNPDLRPEYRHQGKIGFNSSFGKSGIFFSSSFTFNYTRNPIVAAVTVDEQQVRSTQYVNLTHSNDFAAFVNLGVPVKKLNSRFNLSPYLRQGQSMSLLNGVTSEVIQRSAGGAFDYNYSYNDLLDLTLGANIGLTHSEYAVQAQQDQSFINSGYSAEVAMQVLRGLWVTSDFYYTRFRNPQANFEQTIPMLNFSLSKLLLRDNRGEVKLSAVNVLNRNLGVTQSASLNYFEQSVQNTLGSYYMLSFTYHLNRQQGE